VGISKNKTFLNLPEFPGGKDALKNYIKSNLVYPEEALKKRVQGVVQLLAEIDDNGVVNDVHIEKGLGAGCDEEAARLIKNVRFGGVRNRGIRLKTRKKFKIHFKLPPVQKINYILKNKQNHDENQKSGGNSYSYTINLE
jgi:TonB family protein